MLPNVSLHLALLCVIYDYTKYGVSKVWLMALVFVDRLELQDNRAGCFLTRCRS
jgi:hypothetical protein